MRFLQSSLDACKGGPPPAQRNRRRLDADSLPLLVHNWAKANAEATGTPLRWQWPADLSPLVMAFVRPKTTISYTGNLPMDGISRILLAKEGTQQWLDDFWEKQGLADDCGITEETVESALVHMCLAICLQLSELHPGMSADIIALKPVTHWIVCRKMPLKPVIKKHEFCATIGAWLIEASEIIDWHRLEFFDACANGDVALVRALLADATFDVNAYVCVRFRQTPLIAACKNGRIEVIRVLLANQRVDVSVKDLTGISPLFAASECGVEIVRVLVECGADFKHLTTKNGYFPVHFAAANGHLQVIRLLVSLGAAVDKLTAKNGYTPLIVAASKGQTDAVKLLIELGADIAAKDKLGYDALHWASAMGRVSVIRALAALGSDVDNLARNGDSALMDAAFQGQTDAVKALLQLGADVNVVSSLGHSAVGLAAVRHHRDALKVLIEGGADVRYFESFSWCQRLGYESTRIYLLLAETVLKLDICTYLWALAIVSITILMLAIVLIFLLSKLN